MRKERPAIMNKAGSRWKLRKEMAFHVRTNVILIDRKISHSLCYGHDFSLEVDYLKRGMGRGGERGERHDQRDGPLGQSGCGVVQVRVGKGAVLRHHCIRLSMLISAFSHNGLSIEAIRVFCLGKLITRDGVIKSEETQGMFKGEKCVGHIGGGADVACNHGDDLFQTEASEKASKSAARAEWVTPVGKSFLGGLLQKALRVCGLGPDGAVCH